MPSSLQMMKMQSSQLSSSADAQQQRPMYLVASLTVAGAIEDMQPLEMQQDSNTYRVLLAVKFKGEVVFSVYKFGQVFSDEAHDALRPLILPPSVHGANPYTIKGSDKFVGIATNEGSLTVFDEVKGHPLPITFEASVINGQILFDIVGRYLTYVSDELVSDSALTKMDVPSHNHSIYSKILQNLSLTAIDGISKLSDINTLKNILNDNSLKSNLKTYISNLINGMKQTHRVVIMDLVTQRIIASFQPPNGVSNLSLSPFNTHMCTITQRGDQIYKWDITRAPLEVSLLDIQIRGKTGSVVDEIHWSSNDSFQIVTRSSGSIHCFQSDVSQNWVLPNMQASRLCSIKGELLALVGDDLFVIDEKGNTNTKYTLPSHAIPESLLPDYIPIEPVDEIVDRQATVVSRTPLAEVEIETCFMGQPIYATQRMELATYKSSDAYWDSTKVFGNEIEVNRIEFGKGNGEPVFCGEKSDLESAMTSVLVLDEGL
ncbi:CYFA0S02e08394g1_1 [Cyberlindnera fabianii]|uniref:CYFA0S02e08394g1_1 n=1 Tax=Cyberlindnera fabianii TaxID=36022 RepID=A0A061AP36_CYBFA|nr:CYFA0S02e08394g1_1 [Cyberlindnera fabianii]